MLLWPRVPFQKICSYAFEQMLLWIWREYCSWQTFLNKRRFEASLKLCNCRTSWTSDMMAIPELGANRITGSGILNRTGLDRIRMRWSGWPDRTGPDPDNRENFWIYREFRTGWPTPSLYWPCIWSPTFQQIKDRQVNENKINVNDQCIYGLN
jgi:hypothetical protein